MRSPLWRAAFSIRVTPCLPTPYLTLTLAYAMVKASSSGDTIVLPILSIVPTFEIKSRINIQSRQGRGSKISITGTVSLTPTFVCYTPSLVHNIPNLTQQASYKVCPPEQGVFAKFAYILAIQFVLHERFEDNNWIIQCIALHLLVLATLFRCSSGINLVQIWSRWWPGWTCLGSWRGSGW